jgi:alpha-tubulin suppressor-like RCC1 family protein
MYKTIKINSKIPIKKKKYNFICWKPKCFKNPIKIKPTALNSKLYTFGQNNFFNLGRNTLTEKNYFDSNEFIDIKNNISKIIIGNFFCVILNTQGNIYTFGSNERGTLGYYTNNINDPSINPIMIKKFYNVGNQLIKSNLKFVDISCGHNHILALTKNGNVFVWGDNSNGQLGFETSQNLPLFEPRMLNNQKYKKISCGGNISTLIDFNNQVFVSGDNTFGQIGIINDKSINYLTHNNISNIILIICGGYHTIFLTSDFKIFSCGDNQYGQLCYYTDNINNNFIPTEITNFNGKSDVKVKNVFCGLFNTFVLTDDNILFSCGLNSFGNLGRNTSDFSLLQIPFITDNNDVLVSCFNSYTNIGYSSNNIRNFDLTQIDLTQIDLTCNLKIKSVSTGNTHTIILFENGHVASFGDNSNGQLGYITSTQNTYNYSYINIKNVKQVFASSYFTVLLV